jgi:ABC-type Zn uptake system ZnuABC Zn-binding protein ZnuA
MRVTRAQDPIRWLGLILVVALGLTACGQVLTPPPASGRVLVVASILPLADFARQVGGERVQVETLVPRGASPHTYEPTPAQLRSVSQARVLVLNGVGRMASRSWSSRTM